MNNALYAYAVTEAAAALPAVVGLDGAPAPHPVVEGHLAVLASPVPAEWFAPDGRVADPDWVRTQALRHHALCEALTGLALPLAFGAVFSGEAPLRAWLAGQSGRLGAALAEAEGCAEWTVLLRAAAPRRDAWLDAHDPELAALAGEAAGAGPGTRFLIDRRMARAREAARARHLAAATERLRGALDRAARALLPAHGRDGAAGVTALLPRTAAAGLGTVLGPLAEAAGEEGLELALSGPWPAYGFAREALGHDHR